MLHHVKSTDEKRTPTDVLAYINQLPPRRRMALYFNALKVAVGSLVLCGVCTLIFVVIVSEQKIQFLMNEWYIAAFFLVILLLFCLVGASQFRAKPTEANAAVFLGLLLPLLIGAVLSIMLFVMLNAHRF